MSQRIQTQHIKGLIDVDCANAMYEYMASTIDWDDGIRSRRGPTRKAKQLVFEMYPVVDSIIMTALQKLNISVGIYGVYLNYYRDGNDYTPNHSHPGMKQLILSFGCDRVLTMGSKRYTLSSGDAMIFGSSIHGVPEEPSCTQGRISIALFLET